MKKIKIITFGCASNQADSNIMEYILESNGLIVGNFGYDQTDYVIVNSCSVKGPTENKIIDLIKKIPLPKHKIIICGCLISDKKKIKEFIEYSLINPYNINRIDEVVQYLEYNKNPIHLLEYNKSDKLSYINSSAIPIIPILIGCVGNCSYCKTKQAKPLFFSYEKKEIISAIDKCIKKGAYEIWLSSEDNGAYGIDRKETYLDLLKSIEKKYSKSGVMFRFGMGNPEHIYKHLKETKEFFKNTTCFFKFLHIPIQSANDIVLKKMNRKYNSKKIDKIFSELTGIVTLSTDVICGFPTETEKQFGDTYSFISKNKPLITNVSMFWSRPFTKAEKMKQTSSEVKKKRSTKISCLQKRIIKENLNSYVGKKIAVFVDGKDGSLFSGRTRSYVLVKIESKIKLQLGSWVEFKVKRIESNHLVVCDR